MIHAVGPVWRGGSHGEPELLASCYARALALAGAHGLATIAFPAISCGAFGYPLDAATAIAVRAARSGGDGAGIREIVFACFDDEALAAYRRELERLTP